MKSRKPAVPMGRAPLPVARGVQIALQVALVVGLLAWTRDVLGAVLAAPLVAALPGLLRGSRYTGGWLSLLLVIYVAGLLGEAAAVPSRRMVGLGLATIAVLDFVMVVLVVRWSARAEQAQQQVQ